MNICAPSPGYASSLRWTGHRADIMIERAARTNAAYEGRERVIEDDIIEAAELVLPHRMRK